MLFSSLHPPLWSSFGRIYRFATFAFRVSSYTDSPLEHSGILSFPKIIQNLMVQGFKPVCGNVRTMYRLPVPEPCGRSGVLLPLLSSLFKDGVTSA